MDHDSAIPGTRLPDSLRSSCSSVVSAWSGDRSDGRGTSSDAINAGQDVFTRLGLLVDEIGDEKVDDLLEPRIRSKLHSLSRYLNEEKYFTC